MSYKALISVSNPQSIVILVDQSGSMSESIAWNGNTTTKAQAVSQVLNSTIAELLARCNHYGDYLPYFEICVLGYGASGVSTLVGNDRGFVTPAYLAHASLRSTEVVNVRTLPDGRQITTHYKQKIWIEPQAEGNTPMCAALQRAYDLLAPNIHPRLNSHCFPPMVINITDGEITDASPETLKSTAEKLKSIATLDGNALLLNVHISSNSKNSHIFPHVACCPVDDCDNAKNLFEISSVMPEVFNNEIANMSCGQSPHRGFAYNASVVDLMRMLNVSSSTVELSI